MSGTTTGGTEVEATGDPAKGNTGAQPAPSAAMAPVVGDAGAGVSTAGKTGEQEGSEECVNGHPVSVPDGHVVDSAVDVDLPGVVPLRLARHYSTAFRGQASGFGVGGWTCSLEQWIEEGPEGPRFHLDNGKWLALPALSVGELGFERSRRFDVARMGPRSWELRQLETGQVHHFSSDGVASGRALLRAVVDPWGNRLIFHWEGEWLREVVDTAGRRLLLERDAAGRIQRALVLVGDTCPLWYNYGYSEDGELAWAEDALGHRDLYRYDAKHRMVQTTLKNGTSFYYEYDAEGDACIHTWGDGKLHEYKFLREKVEGGLKVTTVGTLEPRVRLFNLKGDLLEDASFDRREVTQKEWDADHLLLRERNALGFQIQYEYGARAELLRSIDEAGNETVYSYADDRLARRTGADGLVTEYFHDGYGALVAVRYATGAQYSFSYDLFGRLQQIFGPQGPIASFQYDAAHNVVTEQDARGAEWAYQYDLLGRPLTRRDPLGNVTRVDYDLLGRPVRVVFPDGSYTESSYDPLGNVARFVDPLGHETLHEYAGTGVLTRQVQRDGGALLEWAFRYDKMERLRVIQNPQTEEYAFWYDWTGRVERERSFDGKELRYDYDLAGRLMKVTAPDQSYRRFSYDRLGNLTKETSTHGPQRFERDRLGRLASATIVEGDEEITVRFERDEFGRITKEWQGEELLLFAYDAEGRRLERQVPACGTTRYSYDVASALARVAHETSSGKRFELELTRDILGREVLRKSLDGRVQVVQGYDALDRLVEQRIGVETSEGLATQRAFAKRSWRYDQAGRVTAIDDLRWGQTRYEYDSLGQLTSAKRGQLHEVFRYDGAGSLRCMLNGLGAKREGTQSPEGSPHGEGWWQMAPGNQLRETGTYSYEYDRCRRRISKTHVATQARTEYVWDCRDRLREVKLSDGRVVRMFYDAFGRRVRKEVWGSLTEARVQAEAALKKAKEEGAQKRGAPILFTAPFGNAPDSKWNTELDAAHRAKLQDEAAAFAALQPEEQAAVAFFQSWGESAAQLGEALGPVLETMAPTVTRFLWDGDELAAERSDERGDRGHVHYPGTFVPLLQIERGEIFVVVTDQVGVPRELIAEDGSIRWSGAYTSWGKLLEEYVDPIAPRGPPGAGTPDAPLLPGLTARGAMTWAYEGKPEVEAKPWGEYAGGAPKVTEVDYRGEEFRGSGAVQEEVPWGYGTAVAHWLARPSAPGARLALDPDNRDAVRSPFRLLGQYWDEETELGCTRFRYWDPETGRWCSPDPLGIWGGENLSGFDGVPTGSVDAWGLATSEFETGTMLTLRKPGDGYDNHEILQASWLEHATDRGLLRKPYDSRYGGQVGGANPAIALTHENHQPITNQQNSALRKAALQTETASQNIEWNLKALHGQLTNAGMSKDAADAKVQSLRTAAYAYARSVIHPCMHAAQGIA